MISGGNIIHRDMSRLVKFMPAFDRASGANSVFHDLDHKSLEPVSTHQTECPVNFTSIVTDVNDP